MLKAAVIGCGPRGQEHARALKDIDGIELVAVAESSAELLRQSTESLGVSGYLTIEELLERARPEIVVLATQARGRAELTERIAMFPGVRAIVVEKPMAMTMAEAEGMLAVCEARGIMLTVSHQLRFCDEFLAMKAAIDAGELGFVEFLRGSCYGNLLNQGPHMLDAIRWFAGGRNILWIMSQWSDAPQLLARHAQGDQAYWDDLSHPAPMWMTHQIAFEGGLRAAMETGLLYQRSGRFMGDWLQKRVTVIGSEGLAECQAAGYFKLLSARRSGWKIREGSIEAYTAATKGFHEELRDALETGLRHRNDARDALKTFEGIIACAQSAVDGSLAVLPLARDRDPLSELQALRRATHAAASPLQTRRLIPTAIHIDRHPPQPEVSVIVALPDHRGLAIECVESWVREQTYPRECFEVIVVTDGSDPGLDTSVKELLGPEDQMICHETTNELLLYDVGARQARGKLLFITEPHCIAERECLEELVKFFLAHSYDGACCRSIGICANPMARMEERFFESGFRTFSREGDWRKVLLRGFAIYRDVYLQAGGFEHGFNRFGEWALAAKLHSQGRRLGYAAGATVRHLYTNNFRELVPPVKDFARGECAYRASSPVEYCERYFGHVEEWAQRESLRPSIARSACRPIWRSLWSGALGGGGWSMLQAQAKALLLFLPTAVLGPRWRLLSYRWLLWMAMARYWVWRFNDRKLYRAYCDAYDRMTRFSRIEFVADHLASSVPEPQESYDYRLSEVREEWLVGFHAIEQWENEPFRWSGPVSILRLRIPTGSYEVKIETRSLRKAAVPLCLGVFFNRHKVASSSIQFSNGLLSFQIHSSMFEQSPEQRLIFTCNPLRPWKVGVPDRRKLGLPMFLIEFTPLVVGQFVRDPSRSLS